MKENVGAEYKNGERWIENERKEETCWNCDQTQNALGWLYQEKNGKYTALILFLWHKCGGGGGGDVWSSMGSGKTNITKSFVYTDYMRRVLANQHVPLTTRWWLWLWVHITSFQGGNKHTYPHTDSTHTQTGPCDCDKLSTHAQRITTCIHTQRHRHHTHSSEIWGPLWQPPSWLGTGQTGVIQEKQSGPTRGLGLLCLWSVTLHHEGNP